MFVNYDLPRYAATFSIASIDATAILVERTVNAYRFTHAALTSPRARAGYRLAKYVTVNVANILFAVALALGATIRELFHHEPAPTPQQKWDAALIPHDDIAQVFDVPEEPAEVEEVTVDDIIALTVIEEIPAPVILCLPPAKEAAEPTGLELLEQVDEAHAAVEVAIDRLTVTQLRKLAKKAGVKGFMKLSKAQLVQRLA